MAKECLFRNYSNNEVRENCNIIFITNYSYHYLERQNAFGVGEFLEIKSKKPKHVLSSDIYEKLETAVKGYVFIPNIDIEDYSYGDNSSSIIVPYGTKIKNVSKI